MTPDELKAKVSTLSQDQLMEALRQLADIDAAAAETAINRGVYAYPAYRAP